MDSVSSIVEQVAASIGCERIIVCLPTLAAETVVPAPPEAERAGIDALARHILWPMARQSPAPQILNKVRLKRDAPLLPYRILFAPVVEESRTLGFVAALRLHSHVSFVEDDLAKLMALGPRIRDLAVREGIAQTALLRRPAFEHEVARRARTTEIAGVIYANLDQLHAINEVFGFHAGDEVISSVGAVWKTYLSQSGGMGSRLSGDRYAAVLFDHTLNQARVWAEEVRAAIEGLDVRDRRLRITASVGVAVMPRGGSFQHALAAAETACRAAKDHGRNRVDVYETGDVSMIRRHNEVRDSRMVIDALENGHFSLHAQPIVDLGAPAAPRHYEMLLRVERPDGQRRSIGEYLQAAERYQLLERVDAWVVEHALRSLGPWAERLQAQDVSFAINVTGHSISQPGFVEAVKAQLQEHRVPGSLLWFEFTETAAVRNMTETHRFVERMRQIGCRLALDDFGTGVSSLLHLKELAVDAIKIDGRFVTDVLGNKRSEALVRALAQIAEQLGLETVAEFVETDAVARRMHALGIQYGQGYLYGRAQPLADVLAEILARTAPAPRAATG